MTHRTLMILATAALASCDNSNPTPSPAPAAYPIETVDSAEPVASFTPTQPARPSHFYDDRDGVLYSYVAALSEDDRKAGKAAGRVVTFAYMGERDGLYSLWQVSPNGSVLSKATCKKPCRVITYDDGTQLGYNEGSIIGGAFADALAGRLVQAQYVSNTPAAPPPQPTPTPNASASSTPVVWSRYERSIIDRWMEANEACRGGTDPAAVEAACAERDGPLSQELAAQNICYGRAGEYGYQHEMHRCGSNSYRMD